MCISDVTLSGTGVLITKEANVFQGMVYQTVDHDPQGEFSGITNVVASKQSFGKLVRSNVGACAVCSCSRRNISRFLFSNCRNVFC
jgi:hypothetical protein